jgi:hypothetical protein
MAREIEVLALREMLIGEDQDCVLCECILDGTEVGRIDPP